MRSFIIVAVILLCIEGALGYEVATASAETAPGTNVVLTMAIGDDGPAFSAQSYSDTAKKFIDCHHCGAIVEHPSEPKGPGEVYYTLRRGSRDDQILSTIYIYQEWNQQGFVNKGKMLIGYKWSGGKMPLTKKVDGTEMMLLVLTVDILNPHKPQLPRKGGCEPNCGMR